MSLEIVLSIVGITMSVAFGTAGLVYAYMANREKARLEDLIRAELCGIAGNIERISISPGWAHEHFQSIHEVALELDRDERVDEILRRAKWGVGDTVAAQRMIRNLLNEVLTLQEGIFKSSRIVHIDRAEDEGVDGDQMS